MKLYAPGEPINVTTELVTSPITTSEPSELSTLNTPLLLSSNDKIQLDKLLSALSKALILTVLVDVL